MRGRSGSLTTPKTIKLSVDTSNQRKKRSSTLLTRTNKGGGTGLEKLKEEGVRAATIYLEQYSG